MLPATCLIVATVFGGVWAHVCEQHSGLRPLLVSTAEPTPAVFAWPEEQVQLHCRPSQSGGCRWMKDSTQLGTDCRLSTTERGTVRCLRGNETCGAIVLSNPRRQQVPEKNRMKRSPSYDYYGDYYEDASPMLDAYWQYDGERNWSYKSSTFLCSKSGTIIDNGKLCDGEMSCENGEDESNCKPSCGPPFVGEHSELSSDVLEAYPDGSNVTYLCHPGFSFGETLSGLNRTCRAGRWTVSPPICRRNVALNRPVSVTGQPMAECSTAVDGALGTWCMLLPGGGPHALAVRLADNATVTRVLVGAFSSRYTVSLRSGNQSRYSELSCPCQVSDDAEIHSAVSGVRVCVCPEDQVEGRRELLIRAESGAFTSLFVSEIVALEASNADLDECALLGRPAHGRFEPAGPGMVKLSCDPGYGPSCSDAVQCSSVRSGDVQLSCLAAECPLPPAITNTEIIHKNGTGWRSVAEYRCRTGYALCPADQNTASSCGTDGLWSIGHISCLPETDIRVVAMRLGQQYERSVAAIRAELLATLSAERNRMQQQLRKLERDVALLQLTVNSSLQAAQAEAAEEQLEPIETEPEREERPRLWLKLA